MQVACDDAVGDKKCTSNHSSNACNGHSNKIMQSNFGQFQIGNPSDQASACELQIWPQELKILLIVKKKIINLSAIGISIRVIIETIEDMDWFDLDPTSISKIIDKILPSIVAWTLCSLKKIVPFVLIDGINLQGRDNGMGKQ